MERFFDLEYINENIRKDPSGFVLKYENAFSEKLADIAEDICADFDHSRLIMLAGPSSSGKTIGATRLANWFVKKGIKVKTIGLDDFYLGCDQCPVNDDGEPDLECLQALDLSLLWECLGGLLDGEQVQLPKFDFKASCRCPEVCEMKLESNDILIVEGLHALNAEIIRKLPQGKIKQMYISVRTNFLHNGQMLLSRRDTRFLRRLVRDYKHRASSPENTFQLWKKVKEGEEKYINPFSSNADYAVDSTMPYEPCAIKSQAVELLQMVKPDSVYFEKAQELIKGLELFEDLPLKYIPENSLLHEFLD